MHVFRPLLLIAGIIVFFLVVRALLAPADFGVGKRGYTYSFQSLSAEKDAGSLPAKFKGSQYCKSCHTREYDTWSTSLHALIKCENCHGPAIDHPSAKRARLEIDRSRAFCLRCHASLPYKESWRASIRGINPDSHYPTAQCYMCHSAHHPVRLTTGTATSSGKDGSKASESLPARESGK